MIFLRRVALLDFEKILDVRAETLVAGECPVAHGASGTGGCPMREGGPGAVAATQTGWVSECPATAGQFQQQQQGDLDPANMVNVVVSTPFPNSHLTSKTAGPF